MKKNNRLDKKQDFDIKYNIPKRSLGRTFKTRKNQKRR